ncbi:hypothetical protein ACSS6W_002666 [Trichoderma asperelloides]
MDSDNSALPTKVEVCRARESRNWVKERRVSQRNGERKHASKRQKSAKCVGRLQARRWKGA